jgi:hypothetical protein
MPTKSEQQRKYIFSLRDKYKNKTDTPKKYKYIWDEGYENKGKLPKKTKKKLVKESLDEDWYPMEQNDFDVWFEENKDSDSLHEDYEDYVFELEQMGLEEETLEFEEWAREEVYNHLFK